MDDALMILADTALLAEYKRKRRFNVTSELPGKKSRAKKRALAFVIQKHRSSHLQYDFRLEHNGVMLSWAISKGPSLDPSVKRLAMQTEDHPIEYNQFEGVIPEGEYGDGTVMIWDHGTREPEEGDVGRGLANGDLKFNTLYGKKHASRDIMQTTQGDDTHGDVHARSTAILTRRRAMKGTLSIAPGWGMTAMRVAMGLIFVTSGYRKFLTGIQGMMKYLQSVSVPLEGIVAPYLITIELVGGALLIVGLFTRWLGLLFTCQFIVATFWVKYRMQGWDPGRLDLMLLAGAFLLFLAGPGRAALDNLWLERN